MWNDEPALYRGKYYAVNGSGDSKRRRSLRTSDLDVARRRLKDFQLTTQQKPVLVGQVFALYQEEKENKYDRLKYIWRVIGPHFGHLRPDQVTRDYCKDYVAKRDAKDGTIIRELGALRAALKWHDPNTPARFWLPAPPPPKHRCLTKKEVSRLIASATEPHIRLYIVLAISTAARRSALLELTWDRVDFSNGRIDLGDDVKNKKRAVVPINATAQQYLLKAFESRLTNYVIEFRGRGGLQDIKGSFSRCVERAGLTNVTPHILRHTAATWMAEAEIPMSEIAQYLGHSSTRVTEKIYARYSTNYLSKAASSLELGAIAPLTCQNTAKDFPELPSNPLKNMVPRERIELSASPLPKHPEVVKYMKSLTFLFNRHPFRG